jgi:hypothetical protein
MTNRLRAFALDQIGNSLFGIDDEAVCALADDPDPDSWKPWEETKCESGQWFLWRDPFKPEKIHADQAEPDAQGYIHMKHGCGLIYYPECQPAKLADDVLAAIAQAKEQYRRRNDL